MKKNIVLINIIFCLMYILGCSGSGGIDTSHEINSINSSAWNYYRSGDYNNAALKFTEIYEKEGVSNEAKRHAYTGKAWAISKSSSLKLASEYFEKGGNLKEAILGKASIYFNDGNYSQAIDLIFESIFYEDSFFVYSPTINELEIKNSDIHFLLGLCYLYRGEAGDYDKALTQINYAQSRDSSNIDIVTAKKVLENFILN